MSFQSWDTRVDDDLTLLSETLEEVLRSSGDPADQKYIEPQSPRRAGAA